MFAERLTSPPYLETVADFSEDTSVLLNEFDDDTPTISCSILSIERATAFIETLN